VGGSVATTVSVSTNSSGVYNSNWVPVGAYTVTVSASGHPTQSKSVNVTTGNTANLNFAMQ
jgi:carboxypeptidase family protein